MVFFHIVLPEAGGRGGEVLRGSDFVLVVADAPDDNHHIIRSNAKGFKITMDRGLRLSGRHVYSELTFNSRRLHRRGKKLRVSRPDFRGIGRIRHSTTNLVPQPTRESVLSPVAHSLRFFVSRPETRQLGLNLPPVHLN
jgi:hypothetical protein